MSKYKFSESERVAIWRADGEKCFYCSTPVRYSELQIDHIVPERISTGELEELRVRLPTNFEINSIDNWVTCHQGCNIRKSNLVFETKAILYYIQMARNRAGKARKTLKEFEIGRENDRFLSALTVRIEQGHLSPAAVLSAVGNLQQSVQPHVDPWVIAFGTNLLDPLPVHSPACDPELSDWLLQRIERDLATTGAVFRRVDDERSGETVSVRFVFWVFDLDRVKGSIDFCWDIMAIHRYSELFEDSSDDLLDRAVVSRYHEVVHNPPGGPLGISACPACGSKRLKYSSFDNERETYYSAECTECGHVSSC
jgi:hypothetical protein